MTVGDADKGRVDQRPHKRRGHLFRKYVRIFATLVSGVLLVSGLVEIYSSYEENKRVLLRVQQEKAAAAAGTIRQFVEQTERQVRWPTVAPTTAQRRDDLDRLLRLAPEVTDLSYLDQAGREQVRVSRLGMDVAGSQVDHSRDPTFLEAKGRHTYLGPVYFRNNSEPYMTIAMAEEGPEAGVIVAEVNLKFIRDVVSDIELGKAGQAYVVDTDGQLVAHPDMGLVLQRRDLSSLPQVRAARAVSSRSRAGLEEATIARDLQGRQILTAWESIEPLKWWVFVEQPLEEAFAPLYASMLRTALLVLLGLVLSLLASLFLARKMTDPVYALRAGAARIGAGALDQRIDVRTGDELEDLSEAFNRMAGQLQASHASLERKVDERTRDLADALEQLRQLGVVSQAVSSTLDLQQVLTTILARAVELSGADGGLIYEFDEAAQEFHLRATDCMPDELVEAIGRASGSGGPIVAEAAMLRAPVNVADLAAEPEDPVRLALRRAEFRALLAVPFLREDRVFGALMVRRKTPGRFAQQTVDLLQTFATQSVLAIQNARLFEEIEHKSLQLEVASRHKSEFLANMSHELRTPLNAIIGFSEILLERMLGELSERQDQSVRDVLSAGQHLLSLINDMLDLSKVEAGRMELDLASFSLAHVLENGRTMLKERAGRHRISLGVDVAPEVGAVVADERKVKQIVFNLLSNAVKFTPDGGRVDVVARRIDGEIQVAVRDTGIGITAEDQGRIFEEFRQVGQGAAKAEGTGLGLALTKKLVELHGGRIWVSSQPGAGTTFTFSLPGRRVEIPDEVAPEAPAPEGGGERMVLLAGGDPRV